MPFDQPQLAGNQSHDFLADYAVATRADGIPTKVDAQGTFFIATDSPEAYPFDMSFDGQSFFKWNVGLALPKPNGFNALWFRSRKDDVTGSYIPVNLEFLAGNVSVTDARLSIVRDPNHYQVFNFQQAATIGKTFATAIIAGGANLVLPGTGTVKDEAGLVIPARSAGAAFQYRKSVVVTNADPGSDLEIYRLLPSENDFTANDDGTFSVDDFDKCERAATVFFRQAWYLETSEDLVVANETGTDMNVRIIELFYPSGVSPALDA